MVIGLTGKNGSGKGEVVQFLQSCGYEAYSLSDILREELKKKGKKITRENLIEIGRALRQKEGFSVLAERTLCKLEPDKNYVIDSIRNPEEVRALRKHRKDFILLSIEAKRSIRFSRIKARNREGDAKTLQTFIQMEEREFKSQDPAAQQLLDTARMADHVVPNNGSLAKLHETLKKKLTAWLKAQPRPSWDTYFIDIARMVALRSNCMKRKVAALIAKDKRIIATGYNGTPRGVKNCNEGGCPRCNSFGKSGAGLEECLCSHAEENSITQSAYHGVNIKDATLYTTFSPCLICTKMIINAGIKEVVYNAHYPLVNVAVGLLREAGVVARKVEFEG